VTEEYDPAGLDEHGILTIRASSTSEHAITDRRQRRTDQRNAAPALAEVWGRPSSRTRTSSSIHHGRTSSGPS
jgi:hypothetical protein